MKLTARKNKYGFYTLCKGKDKEGNELKCYLSVQFKKGFDPKGDVAYIDIEDAFFSCYADSKGNIVPKLFVMSWYPDDSRDDYKEPVGFGDIKADWYVQGGGDIYDEWTKDHKGNEQKEDKMPVSMDDLPF